MNYSSEVFINGREISIAAPSYFIADIASNHDGDLVLAKELIYMAKEAGADAVKFQHFMAEKIVSDYGFGNLKSKLGHQASWKKSVCEVFKECECKRSWTSELAQTAKKAGIDFMSTPYDIDAVDLLDKYVHAYKIGSGDITWTQFISYVAQKHKPVLLATGASTMADVERAVLAVTKETKDIVLMQCNTNYTAKSENFASINLNVLKTYATRYPNMVLGLSDHTVGPSTVLGAIALGARVIEKHFTHDNNAEGPDHPFSVNPTQWKEMVERSRELENALGSGIKNVEENEKSTVIAQQRCIRAKSNLSAGKIIYADDLDFLRPAPLDALKPYQAEFIIGKKLLTSKTLGQEFYFSDFENENGE